MATHPRPTLTTLPAEILSLITSFADLDSLITLKRVCRAFTSLDDRSLWENLFIRLPKFYGTLPQIQPYERDDYGSHDAPYRRWIWAEAERRSDRHRAGLREKVKAIISAAGMEKWRLVRSLTMAPRVSAAGHMMMALNYAAPYLQRLNIDSTPYQPFPSDHTSGHLRRFDLDVRLFNLLLSLPNLTHLQLTSISSAFGDTIIHIINASPNLVSLDVDFDGGIVEPYNDDVAFSPAAATRLERLRFSWRDRAGVEDFPAAALFLGVLRRSPDVRQVNLSFDYNSITEATWDEIFEGLGACKQLKDLRWPEYDVLSDRAELPYLRRLVKLCVSWDNALDNLATMPGLEQIYIHCSHSNPLELLPHLDRHARVFSASFIDSDSFISLADSLREYPHLELIHALPHDMDVSDIEFFSRIEESLSGLSGHVRSMRHGAGREDELILLSFSRQWTKVADRPCLGEDKGPYFPPDHVWLVYEQQDHNGDISMRERCFKRTSEVSWLRFTDFNGKTEPEDIIERVRREDGGEPEKWEKRGVEVGDKAWAVLEEWYPDSNLEA